jgi:hypothetical protein
MPRMVAFMAYTRPTVMTITSMPGYACTQGCTLIPILSAMAALLLEPVRVLGV